jgi:hypothetical protein
MEAPFKPVVSGPEDTRNIDKMFTNESPKETPGNNAFSPNAEKANHFEAFTYAASTDGGKMEKFARKYEKNTK